MVLFIKDNTPATRETWNSFLRDAQADRHTWQSFEQLEKRLLALTRAHWPWKIGSTGVVMRRMARG